MSWEAVQVWRMRLTLRRRARRVEVFAQPREQRARSALSASAADCLLHTKRKRQRWHSVQMSRAEAACAAAQASCTHGRMRRIPDRVLARRLGGFGRVARTHNRGASPVQHQRAMSSARWMRGAGAALICGAMSRRGPRRTATSQACVTRRIASSQPPSALLAQAPESWPSVAGIPATHTKGRTSALVAHRRSCHWRAWISLLMNHRRFRRIPSRAACKALG